MGVFAAYVSQRGRALVDRELYPPKSWTDDRDRCRAAKIPDAREFATRGDLAKTMIQRALASPLPIAWVTADSAYGQEWRLRRMLEEAGVGYVLAVPKSQPVPALGRIDLVIAQAPDEAWERHSCGDGAKGRRVYGWAAAKLSAIPDFDGDQPTHDRWVLARRRLAGPEEIAYYLACAPVGTEVFELARVAGSRWRSRSASRPRRTNAAWISTRSDAVRAGTGTSPSRHTSISDPPLPPERVSRRIGGAPSVRCRSAPGARASPVVTASVVRAAGAWCCALRACS
ncbi:transposase [Streptomyces sp. NPDC096152]|uniref:IS701 family transposase n=1 Tax=Streptomyces sp. NPDC096152 TaxID=3366078 RepID=UPI00380D1FF8